MKSWPLPTVSQTYHPAFIMRENRRFESVCLFDLKRATKLVLKQWEPKWDRSGYIIKPTFDQAVRVLKSLQNKRISYDIETDGEHPLVCQVRCLGLYDGTTGICIPMLHRGEGLLEEFIPPGKKKAVKRRKWTRYWSEAQWLILRGLIQKVFDSAKRLYSQNGQFDRLCLSARELIEVKSANVGENMDGVLGHHIVASHWPHNLGFLASMYTETPFYKSNDDGAAWSSENDDELFSYCVNDCVCQFLICDKLYNEVHERKEDVILYEHDSWYEDQGMRWRKTGMQIDPRALELFQHEYGQKQEKALAAMHRTLEAASKKSGKKIDRAALDELMGKLSAKAEDEGIDEEGNVVEMFNPGSLIQLRLLLRHLQIPLTAETATGELSTAKDFLLAARKELLNTGVKSDAPQLAFLDYLFAWRECSKIRGTYLKPDVLWWNDEYTSVRKRRDAVHCNPRVHANFNFHVVPTGRISSSDNILTQPKEIRGMFVARKKHRLVSGDWDALEMRLGAFVTDDPNYIKLFVEYDAGRSPKPHIVNASVLFGLPLEKELPDKHPGCYRAAKVFVYAIAYGSGQTTVFDKVREEMPDMDFKTFLEVFGRYKKQYPKFFEFQRDIVIKGTHQRFLDSPVLKRRVHYYERVQGEDSPEATKMQNMSYQSGGSDVVGLANRRMMAEVVGPNRQTLRPDEVLEQLCQVHDELLFEVPDRLCEKFAKQFKETCERPPDKEHKHWKLPVAVEVKEPEAEGAPSRWAGVMAAAPCCSRGSHVEYVAKELQSDCTVWYGECESDKCKSKGKKFEVKVPHAEA